MTIGVAIFLIAIGAILKWAVTAHVSWINIQTAGTIIFIVGLVGLVLAVVYIFWAPRRNHRGLDSRLGPQPRISERRNACTQDAAASVSRPPHPSPPAITAPARRRSALSRTTAFAFLLTRNG